MDNLPAGAANDSDAPFNKPVQPFDYAERDSIVKELEHIIERVKQSNGIFTDEFLDLLNELTYVKIDKNGN